MFWFWICLYWLFGFVFYFNRYFGLVFRSVNFVPKGTKIIIIIIIILKNLKLAQKLAQSSN
jgi:hypothetical protein